MKVFNRSHIGFAYLEAFLHSNHWALEHADTLDESFEHPIYVINQEELNAYTPRPEVRIASTFHLHEGSYVGLADNANMVGVTLLTLREEYAEKHSDADQPITAASHLLGFVTSSNGLIHRTSNSVILVPRRMHNSVQLRFLKKPGDKGIDPLSDCFLTLISGLAATSKAFENDPEMMGGTATLNKVINELREKE